MTMFKTTLHATGVLALLALTFGTAATAQELLPIPAPVVVPSPTLVNAGNLWTITAFDDASPVHTQLATQSICFEYVGVVGTQLRYRWRSTTFPDWNGRATQEGDQIFMHGDYARDIGHDGMTWDIVSNKTGAGHWVEWREDGGYGVTIGFANAEFTRVGSCPVTGVIPIVPLQLGPNGAAIPDPFGQTVKQ